MNRSLIASSRVALTLIATTLSVVTLMHSPISTAQAAEALRDTGRSHRSVDGGSGDPGSGGTGHTNGRGSDGTFCSAPPAQQYGQCASQCGDRGVAAFNPGSCGVAATCTCGPSSPTTAALNGVTLPTSVALPRPADPFAGAVDAGGIAQF